MISGPAEPLFQGSDSTAGHLAALWCCNTLEKDSSLSPHGCENPCSWTRPTHLQAGWCPELSPGTPWYGTVAGVKTNRKREGNFISSRTENAKIEKPRKRQIKLILYKVSSVPW